MTQQRVSPISVTSVLPAVPVLSLQAALGQSANLTEWRNSSGSIVANVELGGAFNITPANALNGYSLYVGGIGGAGIITSKTTGTSAHFIQLQNSSNTVVFKIDREGRVVPAATTSVGLIVQGLASQTADLQQWQNSAGTVLAKIKSGGDMLVNSVQDPTSVGPYILFTANNAIVLNTATNKVNFIVRAFSGQTANLQEWQNSSSTIKSRVTSSGDLMGDWAGFTTLGLGASNSYVDSVPLRAYSNNASTIVSVIRGAASQTANLQEWQNSAGTVLASITSNGYLAVGGATTGSFTSIVTVRAGGSSQVGVAIGTEAGTSSDALRIFNATGGTTLTTIKNNGEITAPLATFTANSVSVVPITSKGAASQTANLQEWQNSTGTILARVNSDGIIISGTIQTTSALAQLSEENSGGRFRLTKATAAGSNPGTDVAKIYLRDGTNAGTLKLVVRAGSAGAETTILDNIPQT